MLDLFADLPALQSAAAPTVAAAAAAVEPLPAPPAKRPRTEEAAAGAADEVADALVRLTTHAGSAKKHCKCVELALALVQTPNRVQRKHNKLAFAVRASPASQQHTSEASTQLLEALMADPVRVTAPETRLECSELITAACALEGVFSAKQAPWLRVWRLLAVTANALHTDDSYTLNRAVADVRAAFADTPAYVELATLASIATSDLPADAPPEAAALAERMAAAERAASESEAALWAAWRDHLCLCCEIAWSLYRWPWAQSIVDGLLEGAQEASASKLPPAQQARLQRTYGLVVAARNKRRTGGGGGAGADLTSFERGAAVYAGAEISIRSSVGANTTDGRGETASMNK